MIACPHCASENVNLLEISEVDADCVYECEDCDEQFNADEIVGGGVD